MNQDTFDAATEASEREKCASSFPYFCETYVKVSHPLRGLVPFKLHPFQEDYARVIGNEQFVVNKKFRQGGFTTVEAVWSLWRAAFHEPGSYMHITKTDREAIAISDLLRLVLQFVPDWLIPPPKKANDHELHLDDDRKLSFYTFEAGRGRTIRHLFLHEAAYIKDMERVWNCLFPCIATGGNVVVSSTLNQNDRKKPDWFLKLWLDSKEGVNSFVNFEAPYTGVPEYDNPEWESHVRQSLGERTFNIEVLGLIIESDDEPQHKPAVNLAPRKSGFQIIHRHNQPFRDSVQPYDEKKFLKEQAERLAKKVEEVEKLTDEEPDVITMGPVDPLVAKVLVEADARNAERCPKPLSHPTFTPTLTISEHKEIMDSIAEVVDLGPPEVKSSGLQEDGSVAFELLKLAGVVPNEADEDDPCCYDDFKDDLIGRIKQGMNKDLKLGLDGSRLTVNGLETRIKTKVVEMAFVGLAELAGYEKAMDSVSKLVRRKLKVLF